MSRTHQRSFTNTSQDTVASRSNEPLLVAVLPPEAEPPLERSRFSPDSPTERTFSFGRPIFSQSSSPRSRPLDLEKGPAGSSSSPQGAQPTIGDRFVRLFGDLRVGRRRDDPSVQAAAALVPTKSSVLPPWRPLDVRKAEGVAHCNCRVLPPPQTRRQKWFRRALLSAFVIFLFYLFVNVVFLDIRLYSLSRRPSQMPSTITAPASPQMNTVMLSADAQQCITQYNLTAPGNPTGYPCSTCIPLLATVPSNATAVYTVTRDAMQFCGLRSMWEDANKQGQAALEAGGWVKDVKFCAWNGVRCNGAGHVSSLQLTFPAVPASLPEQFTNLTWLESLEITGNGNSPAGAFPASFGAFTALTSLNLENTALGALPDTLKTLSSLTLVRNAQMGSSLPASIGGSALRSLIVNNEPLTLTAAQSAALCSGQLQNCDLRGSGIRACGACLICHTDIRTDVANAKLMTPDTLYDLVL